MRDLRGRLSLLHYGCWVASKDKIEERGERGVQRDVGVGMVEHRTVRVVSFQMS